MSDQAERMVEWGFKTIVGVLCAVGGWFLAQAFDQLTDHGNRITRVEASQVSPAEVTKLSVAIAELAVSVRHDREDKQELSAQIRELRAELSKR